MGAIKELLCTVQDTIEAGHSAEYAHAYVVAYYQIDPSSQFSHDIMREALHSQDDPLQTSEEG